jgi:hypothetical protein
MTLEPLQATMAFDLSHRVVVVVNGANNKCRRLEDSYN